ncbi:MAG: hypothetical protein IT386_14695 [Deltaproteobacteria bacterium]|nr:hypothetical protein [Deltaproteobacteria bacterium]
MRTGLGAAARRGRWRFELALAALLSVPALAGAEPAAPPSVGAAARVADPAPSALAAWDAGGTLLERAERARLAALQTGLAGFDAAARGLAVRGVARDEADRARAAVAVAPDLPLAQAALARALVSERDVAGAVLAAGRALRGLVVHPEARPWLEANVLLAARNAAFFGALAFLVGLALRHARAVAHDLGDRLSPALPLFARAGVLGLLVLAPAILGQGLAGTAFALFVIGLAYGSPSERRAGWTALLVLVLAVQIGSRAAAHALAALDSDAVAAAYARVERGLPSGADRERLAHAAVVDALAERGLALDARRAGRLSEAAQRYENILATSGGDATLATNAGNVWIALGDVDRAVALHELAVEMSPSPAALYDLSYAYGQAIRPHAQDDMLRRLQREDPKFAFDLAHVQEKLSGGFTLDQPLPPEWLRVRAAQHGVTSALVSELVRPLAPGALGSNTVATSAALLLIAAAVRGGVGRLRRSTACRGCGRRLCPRCDAAGPARDLCVACHRLLERPETADPERRARRLGELERRAALLARARLVASLALPGMAGLLARRPGLGLVGAIAFAAALALVPGLAAGPVDPLVAGGAAALVLALAEALCVGTFGVSVALALRGCRREMS